MPLLAGKRQSASRYVRPPKHPYTHCKPVAWQPCLHTCCKGSGRTLLQGCWCVGGSAARGRRGRYARLSPSDVQPRIPHDTPPELPVLDLHSHNPKVPDHGPPAALQGQPQSWRGASATPAHREPRGQGAPCQNLASRHGHALQAAAAVGPGCRQVSPLRHHLSVLSSSLSSNAAFALTSLALFFCGDMRPKPCHAVHAPFHSCLS